ncbi:MAG: branched-chain amino acid ABC transporter permease [Bacillus subtilis]|nr:branched-chain amino acid ABC transporter permease [Bacillus subtilis]
MFDVDLFWRGFLLSILAVISIYILVDALVLRRRPKRTDKQSKLINVLLAAWIVVLFGLIVNLITLYGVLQTIADKILGFSVLSIATTGIVLIFKTSITTNFAQGIVATFGVFFAANVVTKMASLGFSGLQLALIGMVSGAFVSFLMGLFIDIAIIRKSKYITSIGKQMITMGLVLVVSGLIPVVYGIPTLTVPRLSYGPNIEIPFQDYMISITPHALYAFIIAIVLLALLFSALRFTKWGLGVRATASSEIVAGMMGVNTRLITALSWAIAGALGGVAAYLIAEGGSLSVGMMTETQVNGFMAGILGGFSSFLGPIVGSFLIPVLSAMFFYVSYLWSNTLVYGIILLIILAKPLGLFGKKIAKKV